MEQTRMLAARMFEQNLAPVQIAAILEVDDQSVRRWRRLWRARGVEGLRGRKPPGAKARLSAQQRQQLPDLLAKPPRDYGIEGFLWTTRLIASLIKLKFGVAYHHDHVGHLLRELGWSYQAPARRARERDEQAITHWREQLWPALEKKVATARA
jgi:transposase